MEFSDVIRDRYSCKSYDGRKVEQLFVYGNHDRWGA